MKRILFLYLKSIIVFFCVDFIWLSYIAPQFYRAHIGHLLADEPNLVAALFFYLFFIGGLVGFAILPALQLNNKWLAGLRGAAYGFVTYATFDLTSQAVFKDWPTIVTLVDLAWGSFLCAATTLVVYLLSRKNYLPTQPS